MKNKIHNITHSSGFQYTTQRISLKEAEELLDAIDGEELETYSDENIPRTVYKLYDNRVLSIYYSDATICSSVEGFLFQMEEIEKYIKKIPTIFPIKKILLTKDFKEIIYFKIDQGQMENLFTEKKEVITSNMAIDVLLLSDGKILIKNKIERPSFLFDSKKDYDIFTSYYANVRDRSPILCGRNLYGEKFPNHVIELIDRLAEILDIPSGSLKTGISVGILKYIYRKIVDDEYANELFLPLLAYLGHFDILKAGGEWKMEYNEKYDTWTPDVVNTKGKKAGLPTRMNTILNSENAD